MQEELKKHYKLIVSYNGTAYDGFQNIPGRQTIMGQIINAIHIIDKDVDKVTACSRTDKGVHALSQVIAFSTLRKVTIRKWQYALNSFLPKDIRIVKMNKVNEDFHPRFAAKNKRYRYFINTGKYDLFKKDLVWQLNRKVNISLMKSVAAIFVGEHNFCAFTTDNDKTKQTLINKVDSVSVKKKDDEIVITFIAKRFLRAQVRMMVGACVSVALGRKTIDEVQNGLSGNLRKWTEKAPSCGLYLDKVNY